MRNRMLKKVLLLIGLSLIMSSMAYAQEIAKIEKVKESILYSDKDVEISNYKIENLNINFTVLREKNKFIDYLKWKDNIKAITISDSLSDEAYVHNKDNFYIQNFGEFNFELIHFMNNKIFFLGSFEAPYQAFGHEDFIDFKIESDNSKPKFYFEDKIKKVGVEPIIYSKISQNIPKNIQKYFRNFENYGNPYGKSYLSNEDKLKITLEEIQRALETEYKDIKISIINEKNSLNHGLYELYVRTIYADGPFIDEKYHILDYKNGYVYDIKKCIGVSLIGINSNGTIDYQDDAKEKSLKLSNYPQCKIPLDKYRVNIYLDYADLGYFPEEIKYKLYKEYVTLMKKSFPKEKIQTRKYSNNIEIKSTSQSPKFQNYLVQNTYQNPNQPLVEKDFGRLYRTRLNQALKEKKPEFAGKYIITQWGCDEGKDECTTGGVIDASTGEAIPFPLKYYTHNGEKEIIYKLDSSLIIFAGDFELEDSTKETNQVRFYEMKDGEFLFLKSTPYKQ